MGPIPWGYMSESRLTRGLYGFDYICLCQLCGSLATHGRRLNQFPSCKKKKDWVNGLALLLRSLGIGTCKMSEQTEVGPCNIMSHLAGWFRRHLFYGFVDFHGLWWAPLQPSWVKQSSSTYSKFSILRRTWCEDGRATGRTFMDSWSLSSSVSLDFLLLCLLFLSFVFAFFLQLCLFPLLSENLPSSLAARVLFDLTISILKSGGATVTSVPCYQATDLKEWLIARLWIWKRNEWWGLEEKPHFQTGVNNVVEGAGEEWYIKDLFYSTLIPRYNRELQFSKKCLRVSK